MGSGLFQRGVGIFIALVTGGAAALLWFVVASGDPEVREAPSEGLVLGAWNILYNTAAPTWGVLLMAVAIALLMAVGVALLERRIATRTRRSFDVEVAPLAPKIVMAATRGVYAGPVTVTVLIPAHNEEASLPATISSLQSQSHPPDRIIVVADNCTDGTADVALAAGVEVFHSVDNEHKKGGALNQALAQLLPGQQHNDTVMVMDADTSLDDGFLEVAVRYFTNDRALMALGGLFYGEEGSGVLGQFQRNEYIRYAREIRRRRGRVFVLTGTASIFRPVALSTVADSRGRSIPGEPGQVYDTAALTEDNELTIALKTLGALMVSPPECTVVTELMPTWRALWSQRLRWQRGALENLGAYGFRAPTMRYWAQQLGIGYGVIALTSYLFLILIALLSSADWVWFPFWIGIGILFMVERVVTAWKGGWRARGLAATLFPELFFDTVLNLIYVKGILDIAVGRQAAWKHLDHPGQADPPSSTHQVKESST